MGKRIDRDAALRGNVTIGEENAAAALEVMSRFAVDPRWLIYLPPTMSPCETSDAAGAAGASRRSVRLLPRARACRRSCAKKSTWARGPSSWCAGTSDAAARRGSASPDEAARHRLHAHRPALLRRRRARGGSCSSGCARRSTAAGFWDELATDWVCLDCRADAVVGQGAGAAAHAVRRRRRGGQAAPAARSLAALDRRLPARGADVERAADRVRRARGAWPISYVDAYRHYCWPVNVARRSASSRRFTCWPAKARCTSTSDHVWHMETLARLCRADPAAAARDAVSRRRPDRSRRARPRRSAWWEELTAGGGEGMVVKPLDFIARSREGLVQPAIKCRGREYLRIIYGPEYTRPSTSNACAPATSAPNAPWPPASSPSASKPSTASSPTSPSAASTNASSASWPWKASPSTRGSDLI